MRPTIAKALETSLQLQTDLREIYKDGLHENDALVVLSGQLIEQAVKITTALRQLEVLPTRKVENGR